MSIRIPQVGEGSISRYQGYGAWRYVLIYPWIMNCDRTELAMKYHGTFVKRTYLGDHFNFHSLTDLILFYIAIRNSEYGTN